MEYKCPERILNNFESQRALMGMPIISAPGLRSADDWLFLSLLAAPSFCIQHFRQKWFLVVVSPYVFRGGGHMYKLYRESWRRP